MAETKSSPSAGAGRTAFSLAWALVSTAAILTTSAHADTLIDNVKGATATPFGQVVPFAALLIGDDGKVVRTYAEGEKPDVRPKYRIDGRGMVMKPGIVVFPAVENNLITSGLQKLAKDKGLSGPLPKIGPRDRDIAVAVIQDDNLAIGITTVGTVPTSIEDWLAYRRAGDEGRLKLRILCYADGVATMTAVGGGHVTPWLYHDHLRMAGILINGHVPATKSPLVIKNDEARLRNEMSHGALDGFQVLVSTQTGDEYKRADAAINELRQTYSGEWRWRILMPGSDFDPVPPAKSLLVDDRIGILAPGRYADFYLVAPAPDGHSAAETWVGGVKVYERKP